MDSIGIDRPHSRTFDELTQELLSAGLGLRFQARGASMNPTIRDGEVLHVEAVSAGDLRRGDVVLIGDGENFRAHRLIVAKSEEDIFVTRGDAAEGAELAVRSKQILGRVRAKEVNEGGVVRIIALDGPGAKMRFYRIRLKAVLRKRIRGVPVLRQITKQNQIKKSWGGVHKAIRFLPILASLFMPFSLPAQVAVVASDSGSTQLTTVNSTLTFPHTTVAGANRLTVVGVSLSITNNNALVVTSVTYGGTSLTFWGAHNDATKHRRVEMWYLVNPAVSTTNNVVVTAPTIVGTEGIVAGATDFTGADPVSPLRAFTSADGNSGTASPAVNVASGPNEIVMDTLATGGTQTITVYTAQAQQWKTQSGLTDNTDVAGSGSTRSGALNVPMAETLSGNTTWSAGAVSVRPYQADVSVTDAGNSVLYPGNNLSYTIVVTNNGPESAASVTLTDTVAAGLTTSTSQITSTQGTCTYSAPTITCNIGAMTSGSSVNVTVTAVPSASGSYINTASVTNSVTDLNTSNNTATALADATVYICSAQPVNIGTLSGTINTYYPGTATASAGATSISVGASTGSATAIANGDLLLVMQMQDAAINSSNTLAYGDGVSGSGSTNLNNSGALEFVYAASAVSGGAVSITGAGTGGGLLNTYTSAAASGAQGPRTFQVVRVPQYSSATLSGALTATAWNGSTGGVVALDVSGTLTLGGVTVSVNGLGFRGGAGLQLNGTTGATQTDYRFNAPTTYTGTVVAGEHGSKGEGIAGTPRWVNSGVTYLGTGVEGYPNGSMARGAPGNAGGGGTDNDATGNSENSGGGGGGNGGTGGQGGNSWNSSLTTGGYGGAVFPATPSRVALGGGGGAGSRNNSGGDNQASSGSAGGGIIIFRTGTLSGTVTLSANGTAAYNGTSNDAGGGAGAGGSLLVSSLNGGTLGITATANGGRGGDAWDVDTGGLADRHGPGGGGAGGVILLSGAAASTSVTGGANGTTLATAYPYGAVSGTNGVTQTNIVSSQIPGVRSAAECKLPYVNDTKSHVGNFTEGQTSTYTIAVKNNAQAGSASSGTVTVTDALPVGLTPQTATGTGWSCSVSGQTVTCTRSDALAVGSSYPSITVTVKVTATQTGVLTNTATVSGGGEQASTTYSSSDPTTILSTTHIALNGFKAAANSSQIALTWRTSGETNNLGFNVYRDEDGRKVRLNPSLIAGSALMMRDALPQHGAKVYSWIDRVSSASGGLYWLEDVDVNGARTLHGPVSPEESASIATMAQARTLAEVGETVESLGDASHDAERSAVLDSDAATRRDIQFQLAGRQALKISIKREGWYRVTQPVLIAAGLSSSVNPARLQLFAEGVEQPMRVIGAGPGSGGFGPQAAIEFYGQRIDTYFSDTRVYWLKEGSEAGKRIPRLPYTSGGEQPDSFPHTVELRQRTTYFAALLKENTDNFFGSVVSSAPVEQVLNVNHLAANSLQQTKLKLSLQGVIASAPHDVTVVINGQTLGQMRFTGQELARSTFAVPPGILHDGANTVTLTAQDGENDLSLVDFIQLSYPHTYVAQNHFLKFSAPAGSHIVVTGFRSSPTRLLDISDPAQPEALEFRARTDDSNFTLELSVPWSSPGTHTLLALTDAAFARPFKVAQNHPSDWHSAQPGASLVVITAPQFFRQANALARLHQGEGRSVVLVSVDDLYDEFNYGEHSPYAIRRFLKDAKAKWKQAPEYLLLVGEASLDPRNYLGFGFADLVPTKLIVTAEIKTASDDWLSDLEDTGFAQIPTGRLPVRTATDAEQVVAKIVNYEQGQDRGPWTNQVLVVADRNDATLDFTQEAESVQALLPSSLGITDIFATGLDAGAARQQILDSINSGQLLVNYDGHGSVAQWSGENLFDTDLVASLTNGAHLPVFLTMNCLNGFFQDPGMASLAESLLLSNSGGAVAVWASSGLTSAGPQLQMNQSVVKALFVQSASGDYSVTVGDAIAAAKAGITDVDARKTYILFGDPLLKLQAPTAP